MKKPIACAGGLIASPGAWKRWRPVCRRLSQMPQTQTTPARPAAAPTVPPEFDALPIWKMEPPKLIAMLKDPGSTQFQKAIACKKLAFTGGKEAVQPMAALLGDPQLGCYARCGLEP